MPHRRIAAAVLALLALSPAAALAHQGDPNFRSLIRSVSPVVDGVGVTVVNRDDRFLLVNRSDRTVLVRGYEDEPYARIDGDGTVQVNRSSKALYINRERDGVVAVPDGTDSSAPPDWQTVSRSGRFEWHDHRMHWMGAERPAAVKDPGVRTKVFDYAVPIEVDGRPGEITGTLEWVPTPDGDVPVALIGGLTAVAVLACLGVVWVRRRRGSGGEPGEAW